MTDDLPPGPDIGVAANYHTGQVWLTFPDGRHLLDPEQARELADDLEKSFDLDALESEGYQMRAFADDIHDMADEMENYREHDPDICECTDCGAEYDLARQDYYGPRCPDCTAEAGDE